VSEAWALLLELARRRRTGYAPAEGAGLALPINGEFRETSGWSSCSSVVWHGQRGWLVRTTFPEGVRDLLELHLPLCGPRPTILGHLGQGIDGFIATDSGDSSNVNGTENIVHLHRLRAMCDAVLVGTRTAARDNPRLTVRHVPGHNPVRVVLDPAGALPESLEVFRDGMARTLVACDARRIPAGRRQVGQAEILAVPATDGRLDLAALIDALHERGIACVFVEGGGRTVSDFLAAGLLDRLQIATAPVLIGAGRPGIRLPSVPSMAHCARPAHRVYRMGGDILWDFDLRADPADPAQTPGLSRIL
jgi:riboflavin-specific deaminase-like protein